MCFIFSLLLLIAHNVLEWLTFASGTSRWRELAIHHSITHYPFQPQFNPRTQKREMQAQCQANVPKAEHREAGGAATLCCKKFWPPPSPF
jgi:uncharacterized membrane protein